MDIVVINIYLFLFVCMSVCMLGMFECPIRPEEGVRFPGPGVSGGSELPSIGTGNWSSSRCR